MGTRRTVRRWGTVDRAVATVLRLAADPKRSTEAAADQLLRWPSGGHLLRRVRVRVAAALTTHPSLVGERALGILDVALARVGGPADRPPAFPDHHAGGDDVVPA